MRAGRALLNPADVKGGRSEVDLVPLQVYQLRRPQAMPLGYQRASPFEHGGHYILAEPGIGARNIGFRQTMLAAYDICSLSSRRGLIESDQAVGALPAKPAI